MRGIAIRLGVMGGFALSALGCTGEESLRPFALLDGFTAPESAYFHQPSQTWFVSNPAGQEPGDGYVSRLTADGEWLVPRLIDGLDDPKGIRSDGETLYVADNTRLIALNLTDGGLTSIDAPGALFMNDPAVDPVTGDVYASDIFANAIFRFRNGAAEIFKQGPELESPNGLLVEGRSLLVASLGPDPDPVTFQTSAPGRLSRLDLDTRTLTPLTDRLGALDGLERYGKDLLVSDFFVGVYRVSPDGAATKIFDNATEGFASSADIGFDPVRRRLAIPDLFQSRVGLYEFEFDTSTLEAAAD
jgi:hypothetical protein